MSRRPTYVSRDMCPRAIFALLLCMLGSLVWAVAACGALAKPARPGPPSWRSLTASQNAPARSISRKKTKVSTNANGWGATTEPGTTASVQPDAATVPLPEKSPVSRASSSVPVESTEAPPAATPQQKTAGRLSDGDRIASGEVQTLSPIDVVTTEVAGEEAKDAGNAEKAEQPPVAAPIGDGPASKQYCANISTAAADARFAWQKKALLQTEQEVAKRVSELDQKIAEYQKWLARRDEFSRKAEAVVVTIYGKMKPDAAAQQLAIIDEEIAAAVLTKLDARAASAVMNEMEPKRAARLTAIITGAAKGPGGKPPAGAPAPATSKDKGS